MNSPEPSVNRSTESPNITFFFGLFFGDPSFDSDGFRNLFFGFSTPSADWYWGKLEDEGFKDGPSSTSGREFAGVSGGNFSKDDDGFSDLTNVSGGNFSKDDNGFSEDLTNVSGGNFSKDEDGTFIATGGNSAVRFDVSEGFDNISETFAVASFDGGPCCFCVNFNRDNCCFTASAGGNSSEDKKCSEGCSLEDPLFRGNFLEDNEEGGELNGGFSIPSEVNSFNGATFEPLELFVRKSFAAEDGSCSLELSSSEGSKVPIDASELKSIGGDSSYIS